MPARKKRKTRQESPPPLSGLPEGWQKKGVQYWESVPATVDGVLGGFGTSVIPRMDALGSRLFIHSLFPMLSNVPPPTIDPITSLEQNVMPTRFMAVDGGAGIGRVTKEVLLPLMHEVHLVDPVEKFLSQAKDEVEARHGKWQLLENPDKKVVMFNSPLQDFNPSSPPTNCYFATGEYPSTEKEQRKYILIWIQWCLPHLTDKEIVQFLQNSKAALHDGGYICVKENLVKEGTESEIDQTDWSVTRSEEDYRKLFKAAGLTVCQTKLQDGFPEECFAVKMFAMQ